MILDDDIGVLLLDHTHKLAQHGRLSYAGHILEANLWSSCGYQLFSDACIVLSGMDGRGSDTEGSLGYHASLESIFDAGNNVAYIIESAEDAGYVHSLCMLYLIHKAAYIGRYREHAQRVESTVEHVGLDANFVERLGEGANCLVGVFSIKQVDLLECSTIGLYAGKASHADDGWCHTDKLISSRLILS
jgi:hypothetical protein